ncbi:MAG: sulfotransferase [Actinomycetota bacterium]
MANGRPPVIVIGMHRSGTSMLGRLMVDQGYFPGARLQSNDHHEALFFQNLNRWIYAQAGADWDHPSGLRALVDTPTSRELIADYLDLSLRSPRALDFLGPKRFARYRSVQGITEPWGWKDPRTTFTLPFWLDVFPDAKIVHVKRHGVDVANSLVVRRRRLLEEAAQSYRKRRLMYLVRPRLSGFAPGVQMTSLDAGLDLWDAYVSESDRHVEALGDRAMELRFEDLLDEPTKTLTALAEFCDLRTTTTDGRPLGDGIRRDRGAAYLTDPELNEFARSRAETLAKHGYTP